MKFRIYLPNMLWLVLLPVFFVTLPGCANAEAAVPDYRFSVRVEFTSDELARPGATEIGLGFEVLKRPEERDYVLKPQVAITLRSICTTTFEEPIPGGAQGLWNASFRADCNTVQALNAAGESHGWRLVFVDPSGEMVLPPQVAVAYSSVAVKELSKSEPGIGYALKAEGGFAASGFIIDAAEHVVDSIQWQLDPESKLATHKLVCVVRPRRQVADHQSPGTTPQGHLSFHIATSPSLTPTAVWQALRILLREKNGKRWTKVPLRVKPTSSDALNISLAELLGGKTLEMYLALETKTETRLIPFATEVGGDLVYHSMLEPNPATEPLFYLYIPRIPHFKFTVRAIDSQGEPQAGTTVVAKLVDERRQTVEEAQQQTDDTGRAQLQLFSTKAQSLVCHCFRPGYRLVSYQLSPQQLNSMGELQCKLKKLDSPVSATASEPESIPAQLVTIQVLSAKQGVPRPVPAAVLGVETGGQMAAEASTDDRGLAIIPLEPTEAKRSLRISKECFMPQSQELPSHDLEAPLRILLERACIEVSLSLRLLDARKGTGLSHTGKARVELRQGKDVYSQELLFDGGYATHDLLFERGKGPLQIQAQIDGFRPQSTTIEDLQEGFNEVPLELYRQGTGLLLLVSSAQNWRGYVDARSSMIAVVDELVKSDSAYAHLDLGALGGELLSLERGQMKDPKAVRRVLQTFDGITASRGLFQPSELLSLVRKYRQTLAEAGDWQVVLLVPHNDVLTDSDSITSQPFQELIAELRQAEIRLNILEDGGKTEIYKELCKALDGRYESLKSDGQTEFRRVLKKVLKL